MSVRQGTETEFREELTRLLQSENLRNSESLRKLLAYLGAAYGEGRGRSLKEYSIGRDVMGKPEDYDPRIDASVRVQISKLRQRLEQYYATEGRESPYRIRLPKGRFELVLEPIPPPATSGVALAALGRWRAAAIVLAGLALVLLVAVVALWRAEPQQNAAPVAAMTREMRLFWGPFLDSEQPLTVVLGSPLFLRFHSTYFRDPWVNTWEEAQARLPLAEMQETLGSETAATPTHRWAPFGEAVAAFRLAQFLSPVRNNLQIRRSSVLSWEHMRSSDLIFVGPSKFNPQLRDLPVEQDFIIEGGEIRNLRPREGELPVYRRQTPPEVEDIPSDYAVITRVHGAKGWGEILVLASTTTEGTWAAAEYVSDPANLAEMLRKISPDLSSIPERYQVVIHCLFKNQVPLQSQYVTHHELSERTHDGSATVE
jgi:hypothetical protein